MTVEPIKNFDASILRPGDVLLYSGSGIFSTLIKIKTWSRYSHCEVYDGARTSLASRDGIGVGRYLVRLDGLRVVVRPKGNLVLETGRAWFKTVDGQKYDWAGLLSFTWAGWQGKENNAQFCSEFLVRYLRKCGFDPFNGYDADGIAPSELAKNSGFDVIWSAEGEPFSRKEAA
jgi:hypothetical protein